VYLGFAFALALASIPSSAQSIFGTITGTVQDQSGAVVPGANVTLTDKRSGAVRRAVSNAEGYYSFSSVPVGAYSISVEAKGFQKAVTEGIEVTGSSSQTFLSKLAVATGNEVVEITGTADQIIPIDSGEKSTVLQEKQLQDFTSVGRNAAEFIKILPGFSPRNNSDPVQSSSDFSGEVTGINGNGDGGSQSPLNGGYVANGAGTTNKTGANGFVQNIDITADGAHVSDPGCNCATPVNPNTDMIQEFQVLTSNYGADNAKGPIIINTVGKSGGRDFHGEGYFYGRDYALNANRWLNDHLKINKPANKFFFPGGNIGGPVLFPHSDFNKNRDKLFFFSGFEYYYQTLDTGLLGATVPTQSMLGGDFSPTSLAALGTKTAGGGAPSALDPCLTINPTPVYGNPSNVKSPDPCFGGTVGSPTPRQFWGGLVSVLPGGAAPMPGGIIPSSLIDPSGQNLLGKAYPAPNANSNITGGDNYIQEVAFNQNMYQWYSKVDYNISDNTKLYVRYNLQRERQLFPIGLWWRNAQQVPYPTPVVGPNRSDSVSASLTHVFSPTLSNEFVFGYTYIDFPNVFENKSKVSKTALGIPFTGLFHNGVDQIPSATGWGGEFATILNPGGFEAGGAQGLFAKKHLPTVSDTVSKVWGTHTVKFGAYYEFVINNQPNNTNSNGLFIEAGWAGGSSGNPYADLLGGFAGQYQETNFSNIHNEGYNTIEGFATDSWKVTKRLTVDYGARFSHLGNWYDRLGNGFAVWNSSLYNGTVGSGFDFHKKDSSIPTSGLATRALFFQPRFGLAYDVFGTGRTVLRGGWGRFRYHNAQFTQGLDQPVNVETPTLNSVNIAQIQTAASGVSLPFGTGAVSRTDDQSPLTTSYSFTISQKLPFASLLEASYVGNQSNYFLNGTGPGTNVNVIPYGTLFNIGKNPNVGSGEYLYGKYPIYQAINVAQHNLYSNYNAMQLSWVRQKGAYDISLNYTYGKSLGIVGLNQLDLRRDYGPAQFDRRHVFNAAYSINLPSPVRGNKAMEGVVNGWQLSGITQVQSGVNLTGNSNGGNGDFNTGGNIGGLTTTTGYNISAQSINGTDQIPLMPIVTCDPRKGLGPHQYINGNCFQLPTAPGTNGNAVLPEIFGPSFWSSDLSLFKNFQISESKKLQFRASAFNFLNHSLWTMAGSGYGQGNMNLVFKNSTTNTNNTFGVAPYKVGNRIVELAVKFYF
jgi:hypothetical protein